MQAIKSATSWSAELLEGEQGAWVKTSRFHPRRQFADLIVVSADPTSDISNTKKIERVMKNGRWVELGYPPGIFHVYRSCPLACGIDPCARDQLDCNPQA